MALSALDDLEERGLQDLESNDNSVTQQKPPPVGLEAREA